MPFTLTSRAFVDGGRIPRQFTCDGANMPPPLTWSGPPEGTRSFALILDDADSPGPAFAHWVLYDIPARVTAWPTELSCKTVRNGFGRSGYGGPCPRPNEGLRRYVFSVYALDIRFLPVTREGVDGLRAALEAHTLATSHLVGYYEREADR